jgi:light-regulated signal transduction histidine kinase (bacteriophytochrome)
MNDSKTRQKKALGNKTIFSLALLLTLLVFTIDLFTPFGDVHWLFYLVPLLLIYQTENTSYTLGTLLLCIVFMALGRIFEFDVPNPKHIVAMDTINRIEGIFAFLLFTVIINRLIKSRKHFQQLSSELEYANKEIESFSYSAAHDLKSPLRAMNGFGQILMNDYENCLDETGKDCLQRIITSSTKMSSLIDDMLNLSKISLQEISLQENNISSIAASITDELKKGAPDRDATIRIRSNVKARADARLITIALSNLLENAWKYTANNKNTEIEFATIEKNKQVVYFIKDNGAGFDMNYAQRLFEPFKRLHSESEFPGTGIGLSIVDRIIRKHGGNVWGEGEIGKGATFYFTLPRK